MVTALDFAYALLIVAAFPLLDHFVIMPEARRRAATDLESAKAWFCRSTLAALWVISALGVALWIGQARAWSGLGFIAPGGWRAWVAIGLVGLFVLQSVLSLPKVARSEKARASVRRRFGSLGLAGSLLPSTRSGLAWWAVLSLSAGLGEEFMFRGYLIWVLAPFLGWWGAAAVSLFFFAIAHAYQGRTGILVSATVGLFLTATVAVLHSLLPAIVLHALMDLSSGCIAWVASRGPPAGEEVRA